MKIAVSAMAPSLDADIDPRLGRCRYFVVVDPDSTEFEAIENSRAMVSGGAGIASAQMISGKGIEAVLTGNCGPNAFQVLEAAGIKVITGVTGKIRDAIERYNEGNLQPGSEPSTDAKSGVNPGMSRGRGMGKGMGMGRGRNF